MRERSKREKWGRGGGEGSGRETEGGEVARNEENR